MNDNMKTLLKFMQDKNACKKAYYYALKFKTPEELWENCTRGDWMLWFISKTIGNGCRKKLVFTACQCPRSSLKYVTDGELSPLRAIETAEAWCRGEATIDDVRTAADASFAYATADGTSFAAFIAAYTAYAAAHTAYATNVAADEAVRSGLGLETAEIVRQNYTLSEIMAAIAK